MPWGFESPHGCYNKFVQGITIRNNDKEDTVQILSCGDLIHLTVQLHRGEFIYLTEYSMKQTIQ